MWTDASSMWSRTVQTLSFAEKNTDSKQLIASYCVYIKISKEVIMVLTVKYLQCDTISF